MIQLQKSITEAAGKRRGRVSAREGGLMRLDKYLAEAAQCTRSESREAIRSGRVSVNGAVCKRPEQQVSEMDSIQLDGIHLAHLLFRPFADRAVDADPPAA